MGKLLCGWGHTDITPPGKMMLVGQFNTRIAEKALDPLTATVLAVKPEGGEVIFWVSLDLLMIDRETTSMLADEISKHIDGFARDRLMCSCIHTHTGPFLKSDAFEGWGESFRVVTPDGLIAPEAYRSTYFIPRIAEACVQAYDDLKPSGVSPVLGHAVIGHPRRVHYRDGSSVMYGTTDDYNFDSLEGAVDNGIEMMYIYDTERNLTGLILNVNCPAQVLEHMSCYTADYVGYLRMIMDVNVLMVIGAAGNVSPRDMLRRGRGEPAMNSVEGAKEIAKRLRCCFDYSREKADGNISYDVEFGYIYEEIPLGLRTVTMEQFAKASAEYKRYLDKYDGDPLKFSQADKVAAQLSAGTVARGKRQNISSLYYAPVHAMRINDSAFITNPFELYGEYGMRMRARAKAEHTFTVQLTDDYGDYLPTPEAVAGGSYSTTVSNCTVSCDGGEALTERSIEIINNVLFKQQ